MVLYRDKVINSWILFFDMPNQIWLVGTVKDISFIKIVL